jgi:hypothetical protein
MRRPRWPAPLLISAEAGSSRTVLVQPKALGSDG